MKLDVQTSCGLMNQCSSWWMLCFQKWANRWNLGWSCWAFGPSSSTCGLAECGTAGSTQQATQSSLEDCSHLINDFPMFGYVWVIFQNCSHSKRSIPQNCFVVQLQPFSFNPALPSGATWGCHGEVTIPWVQAWWVHPHVCWDTGPLYLTRQN